MPTLWIVSLLLLVLTFALTAHATVAQPYRTKLDRVLKKVVPQSTYDTIKDQKVVPQSTYDTIKDQIIAHQSTGEVGDE